MNFMENEKKNKIAAKKVFLGKTGQIWHSRIFYVNLRMYFLKICGIVLLWINNITGSPLMDQRHRWLYENK